MQPRAGASRARGAEPPAAAAPPGPVTVPERRRPYRRILKRVGAFFALAIGFLLVLASISFGTGFFPSVRAQLGVRISPFLPPPLNIYSSTEASSLVMLLIATGFLVVGSVEVADALLGSTSRFAPSVETAVNTSPVVMSLGTNVSETMIKAGITGSPLAYVRRFAIYCVASALIILPTSIAATLILDDPLPLAANAIPFLILLYPSMVIRSKVGDTVRGVDEELPYFAIFAAILQSAGLTLYNGLVKVAGAGLFKWVGYEGMLISRESTFFGRTQVGAIAERGSQHPSEKFRAYLQGYTSILASGGDAASYLEDKAKDLIYWNEFRWRSYAQSASDLGEAIIAIFFTLPLIVVAGAFVSAGDTLFLIMGTIGLVIPIMAVLEYTTILRMQPQTYDTVRGWPLPAAGAGIIAFGALYEFYQPLWLSAAGGIIAFSLVYGWSTYWQLREVRKCEEALPQFMRDITEYKKIGYDITKAVRRLSSERSYNKNFDGVLDDVSSQLQLGSSVGEVIVKTRSWLTKMVFYLLGEVVETGGGTPSLLESVTNFTQRIVGVRRETKASMRVYGLLAYATPVGLAVVIMTMYYMLQQFGGLLGSGVSIGILSGALALPASFLTLSKVMVVETAAVAGFLAGKTIDFTGRNTFRIAIGVSLAVVSIFAIQFLIPQLGVFSV